MKKKKSKTYNIIVCDDGRLSLLSNTSNFMTKPMTREEVLEYVKKAEKNNEKQRS